MNYKEMREYKEMNGCNVTQNNYKETQNYLSTTSAYLVLQIEDIYLYDLFYK